MKTKITAEIFRNSFYYPAPGFDIQPLKRFTHLCDNFLYANLYLSKDQVLNWYTNQLNRGDFEILTTEVFEDFREEEYFELDSNYKSHLINWPSQYMNSYELNDYLNVFQPAKDEPQFLIHFQVKRKSQNKVINLYYFSGEGIASYILLSQYGKFAPKILATIQTGIMERPTGIMNRFFNNTSHSKPDFWLRGFEPDHYFYGFRGDDNDSLANLGVFSEIVMNFRNWICGRYNEYADNRRYVKAFVTKEQSQLNHVILNEFSNENHQYHIGKLDLNNFANTQNYVVCGAHLLNNLMQINPNFRGESWEKILGYGNTSNVTEQINLLNNFLVANNITDRLSIFPFCNEDEGKLYHNSIVKIPNSTETFLFSPYDFLDLFENKLDEFKYASINSKPIKPHDNSAKYFDQIYSRRFGHRLEQLTQFNLGVINRYLNLPEKHKVLDFGAGTGRISIPLTELGYEVTAIDCCKEMLNQLRIKAQMQQVSIDTFEDLNGIESNSYDMAIAIFTVLAYILTESELKNVFDKIFKALKPGAYFLFDLESIEHYHQIQNAKNGYVLKNDNETITVHFPDLNGTLCNYEERGNINIEGVNYQYQESFQINFWQENAVHKMLTEIGFSRLEMLTMGSANYFVYQKSI